MTSNQQPPETTSGAELEKNKALNQIQALAHANDLSIDEITTYLRNTGKRDTKKQVNIVKKLFAYIGGIFVFAGIGLLFSILWPDINSAQRVIITLGSGIAAYIGGFACARAPKYEGAATPLFLISAFMQPFGITVFLREFMPASGDVAQAILFITSVLGIQYLLAFSSLRRTALLFFSLLFGYMAYVTAIDIMDVGRELALLTMGASQILLAAAISKTRHHGITPFGYFFGGSFFLIGIGAFLINTPLEMLYLAMNIGLIYASITLTSRTLLFVSVLGLISYLGYFTFEYFANFIGWPVAMIVMGLVMIGLSSYAVKLGQKIGQRRSAG